MRANYAELQNAYAAYAAEGKPVITRRQGGITDLDRKLAKSSEPRSEYEAWRAMQQPVDRSTPN